MTKPRHGVRPEMRVNANHVRPVSDRHRQELALGMPTAFVRRAQRIGLPEENRHHPLYLATTGSSFTTGA